MRTQMAVATILAVLAAPCTADVIGDIQDLAKRVFTVPQPVYVRGIAIVNLAMFDAANAIERRYQPYRPQAAPPPAANADAAALGAGCAALAALQRTEIAAACDRIAAGLPRGSAIDDSRRYGEGVATALVEARKDDGMIAPNAYRPLTSPGYYVPTTLPLGFELTTAKPFAMTAPWQFRPGPPPSLASEQWARDFNEVKALGARNSTQRTAAQTATAHFFASAGAQQFVDAIPGIPADTGASAADRARFFALLYVAINDAGIAHFDAKYAYNHWRPITAIRNADQDGNDATARDATWLALIETPMHPEYPCAHCNVSAAFGTIAFAFLGRGDAAKPLTVPSAAASGTVPTTRQWRSASTIAAEVADARVWSGVHYRNSGMVGAAMGAALGEYILATQLRPLR